jgi:hypothetical protein
LPWREKGTGEKRAECERQRERERERFLLSEATSEAYNSLPKTVFHFHDCEVIWKLFQELRLKAKYLNKRYVYCSRHLGNNKGYRSYEPGTMDENQNIYIS